MGDITFDVDDRLRDIAKIMDDHFAAFAKYANNSFSQPY
jgi:hypothetical protein